VAGLDHARAGKNGVPRRRLARTRAIAYHSSEPMATSPLKIHADADLAGGTLLLALNGWMDGGFVSTGTVRHLMRGRELVHVAHVEPEGFYVDNLPGSMELATALRPQVSYEAGLITSFDMAGNDLYADVDNKLAFFIGKEPNLRWQTFAKSIFSIVHHLRVDRIIFVGSFGGSVPHTRDPRLFGAVSDKSLLGLLDEYGLKPTEYSGPASFATYLLSRSPAEKVGMLSIACEIPGYLEGANPISIEAVTRRLSKMLNLHVDFAELRKASTDWEQQVSEAVEKDKSLAKTIRKLEEQYDNELVKAMEP
jgi:proteasome assembly chaperone (PAC2) family protein